MTGNECSERSVGNRVVPDAWVLGEHKASDPAVGTRISGGQGPALEDLGVAEAPLSQSLATLEQPLHPRCRDLQDPCCLPAIKQRPPKLVGAIAEEGPFHQAKLRPYAVQPLAFALPAASRPGTRPDRSCGQSTDAPAGPAARGSFGMRAFLSTPTGTVVLAVLLAGGCGDGGDDETATVTQTTTVEQAAATQPAQAKPDPAPQPIEAAEYVERFYGLIDNYSYRSAWPLLPESVRDEAGSFEEWRRGYRVNIRSIPHNVRINSSSSSAVEIGVEVEAKDYDACDGHKVIQTFAGAWSFTRAGDEWVPQSIAMDKTSGETPRVFASDCPGTATGGGYGGGGYDDDGGYGYGDDDGGGYGYGGGGGGGGGYQGLQSTPGGDGTIDCDQIGSTDIYVGSDDPNGLDADGDGYACES